MITFEYMINDAMGALGITSCPVDIAQDLIRKSAIHFCQQTHIWQQEVILDAQKGNGSYPIELEDCAQVLMIKYLQVGYPNNNCRVGSWNDVCCWSQKYYPKRRGAGYSCCVGNNVYSLSDRTTLNISPAPTIDSIKAIHLSIAVAPTTDSCGIPEEIYDKWNEYIAYGAGYRILTMNKRPWTNMALAKEMRKDYEAGIVRAKNEAWRTVNGGPLYITPVYF